MTEEETGREVAGSQMENSPTVHGKRGRGLSLGEVFGRRMTRSNLHFHVIRSPVCRRGGGQSECGENHLEAIIWLV